MREKKSHIINYQHVSIAFAIIIRVGLQECSFNLVMRDKICFIHEHLSIIIHKFGRSLMHGYGT